MIAIIAAVATGIVLWTIIMPLVIYLSILTDTGDGMEGHRIPPDDPDFYKKYKGLVLKIYF